MRPFWDENEGQPQKIERGGRKTLDIALPVVAIDLFEGLRTPRTGHADPYCAHRIERVAVRAGESGRGDGVVAAGHAADAFGHRRRDLGAHDAVLFDGLRRHAENVLLDGNRIRGDRSQIIGGRTGNGGDQVRNLAARAGFRSAQGLAGCLQQAAHGGFQGVILV